MQRFASSGWGGQNLGALAVIAARNEAGYIEVTIRSLIEEGLEVVLIDNGSVDGTRELAERFVGGGLLAIRDLPWTGVMDMRKLLEAKAAVFAGSRHEWHLHLDADEWPRANVEMPLGEFLAREVSPAHLVVNFSEFVFLPPNDTDMWGRDYRRIATRYYAFAPSPRRLMRAWRRALDGQHLASAGHLVEGIAASQIHPEDQALRHYIGLSWSHAIAKRADRGYASADLANGWHINRLDLRAARPIVESPYLREAVPWNTRSLDACAPSRFHFWERGFRETAGAPAG